ncbi:DUF7402 domain-containing protein, partial [Kineococcus rubinsiae]|uniref:DUF7402 domain-containing protein n=1 Tax=Kineococcus rubinsiae TaxID=2609562 RepID=UPI001AD914B8
MPLVVRTVPDHAREGLRRTRALLRSVRGPGRRLLAVAVSTAVLQALVVTGPASIASAAGVLDDAACSPRSSITVDAHTDDDLFFQNPDVLRAVAVATTGASCYRGVYVTAGDAGRATSTGYWQAREQGVQAAYATMAGVADEWTATTRTFAGKPVVVATLRDAPTVSLAFLRLPDGNVDGSGFGTTRYASLQKLYTGSIATISTVDSGAGAGASYTRAQLSATLGALVLAQRASHVRTLDFTGTFGDGDHSDHHAVGYLVRDEVRAVAPGATLAGYSGYPGAGSPVNVPTTSPEFTAKAAAFEAYAPYDALLECRTAQDCLTGSRRGDEGAWLQRQYTVAGSQQPDPSTDPTTLPPTTTPTTSPTSPPVGSSVDLARSASVVASSENSGTGQTAAKAVDGVVDGYPGVSSAEWASAGEGVGASLTLSWPAAVSLSRVVLFDRPNLDDRVTSGTLTFSDGSSVAVGALGDDGS